MLRQPSLGALFLILVCGCQPSASEGVEPEPAAEAAQSSAEAAGQSSTEASDAVAAATSATEGEEVALQILDYEGIQKLLAGHRGKVVVMDCWSTWCEPCIKEFPNLVALDKQHSDDAVACVSLSFDYSGLGKAEDLQEDVLSFLRDQQASFDNVLSSTADTELYERFGFASVPCVLVYNQQGELARKFDASDPSKPFSYADVSALVDQLLK